MADYLMILGGLVGLLAGGEALVRGSVGLARRLGMPSFLIGLTVVGFGTSAPELLVSVDAAWRGQPAIAVGNVVGSNTANILLILGLSALIWPVAVQGPTLRRDGAVMLAAGLVLVVPFALGELGRLTGAALVAALVLYLVWAYRQRGADVTGPEPADPTPRGAILWVLAGLAALIVGARLLVDGAVAIAEGFGISQAFIGLTIVAVGTSLPELATSLIAAFRRQSDIALGNIVGSNIFNVLGILGVTALIAPIPVASRFLRFDLPVMLAATLVLAVLMIARPLIGRVAGLAMLVAYASYVLAARG
ncbi:sodium:calcium antiporter [Rhodobacteraceae bacterium WD3A24]|nr:sodium:calcium antiporter [Rhodobacteraceae bacterium WD3A24]